jgi:adenine specific DNA methylase Mod
MTATSDGNSYNRTELVWAGKRTQVDRVALPFQRVETINAPRGGDMFSSLKEDGGWRNKLIWGDNKLVMASLLRGDPDAGIESLAGKVDLIYIDPPFDTGADFSYRTRVGDGQIEADGKEPSILEQLAYRDTWGGGTDTYLQVMHDRLTLMRDLLSENGSIFVHLDYHVGHFVKILLDEIFGRHRFQNEII